MPTTITSAGITFNDATSLTSANIGTAQIANGSVTAAKLGTTEQKQIAKAWVNFNTRTSPATIRSSYNVSSITIVSTGCAQINFQTPMQDTNYSMIGTSSFYLNTPVDGQILCEGDTGTPITSRTTSSIRVLTASISAYLNSISVNVAIFGN